MPVLKSKAWTLADFHGSCGLIATINDMVRGGGACTFLDVCYSTQNILIQNKKKVSFSGIAVARSLSFFSVCFYSYYYDFFFVFIFIRFYFFVCVLYVIEAMQ